MGRDRWLIMRWAINNSLIDFYLTMCIVNSSEEEMARSTFVVVGVSTLVIETRTKSTCTTTLFNLPLPPLSRLLMKWFILQLNVHVF